MGAPSKLRLGGNRQSLQNVVVLQFEKMLSSRPKQIA
jgi:hypothetical protein